MDRSPAGAVTTGHLLAGSGRDAQSGHVALVLLAGQGPTRRDTIERDLLARMRGVPR
ncbi:hypothetical protein [Streptomyces sp. NPDC004728]|uniref:hypothetical protein n=1 Tax=Streptomyces sp. NPDC004728 TaxID=3154289 RepID=UPI0033AD8AE3